MPTTPRGQGKEPPDDGGIGGSADLAELEELCRRADAEWQKVVEWLPEQEAELEKLLAGSTGGSWRGFWPESLPDVASDVSAVGRDLVGRT